MKINIIQATTDHTGLIAPLFDAYRQFYEQPTNPDLARAYIHDRLSKNECTIFLALNANKEALGFTLLYPGFCSVAAKNIWVLYDLFVTPQARRTGIARALMNRAKELGVATASAWLKLETAHTNIAGQTLYESQGWEKDDEFRTYFLSLNE
jgi:ribosomal protein S18 acetylase RimI-like enzyme